MRKINFVFFLLFIKGTVLYSQELTISEQIKSDRDSQLTELSNKLKINEDEMKIISDRINAQSTRTVSSAKINDLGNLQLKLEERIKILEESPKTKINLNGQLAFIELLSIQRDLKPATLFLSSQSFFANSGSIGNLQDYQSFNDWKIEYNSWSQSQDKNDEMLQLINSSLNLISDVSNKVPLYGSIMQTASSGITMIVSSLGKKNKNLRAKTPAMLRTLNATSQFENQKIIIDNEWQSINKELNQLQTENQEILNEQMDYYHVSQADFKSQYINAGLESIRDGFKQTCRSAINNKIQSLETDIKTKGKWMGQIETFMYKVQSLRLRFGHLTNRMKTNISRYHELITLFSDSSKFPTEFTSKIVGLNSSLNAVSKNFDDSFSPEKYIEDSAIMYVEKHQ